MRTTIPLTFTSLLLTVSNLSAAMLYVSLGSTNPTPPYATWATAASSIHDGMNNWQEWISGTNPTNELSALKMLAPSPAVSGMSVSWQSVAGISYTLERSTSLAAQPTFSILQSNLVGQPLTTTYTDTNALGPGPFFYRVGVKAP